MSSDFDLMTRREAAAVLKISVRTLERWVAQRRITFVRYPRGVSGRGEIRFRRRELLQWLERKTVKASPIWTRARGEREEDTARDIRA